MPDDLGRRAPEDPNRINVNQPWEVDYWTKKYGVSEGTLNKAVDAVGDSSEEVEKWLRRYDYI